MVSRTVPSWTLIGLIQAFVDLAIAYFLLCGSTLGFFAWKFYHLFGFYYLPCPCAGFFGYQNSSLCWHKLLIEWPARKIYCVQNLALKRFPFNNLVCLNDHELNSNPKSITDRKFGNGVVELEVEACSSSPSSIRLQTVVDKESGFDAKGKKVINQKHKSGIRRRRRAAFGYGKSSPVLFSGNFPSAVAGVSCSSHNSGGETRSEISENLGLASEVEDSFPDYKIAPTGTDVGEGTWHGFESSNGGEGATSIKKFTRTINEKLGISGDAENRIRMLEQALEEEKAAHAALYLELEKERVAAATAADEAMAMILRLQEDKASIEMEARQYQRMIDEKFAYDEEEMNILKEILVRREKENHLLEKEVEAYREMNILGDEQQECDFSYTLNSEGKRPLVSLGLDEDPLLMVNQMVSAGSTGKKEVGKDSSWLSKNEAPSAGKRSYIAAINVAEKGDDDTLVCQAIATNNSAHNVGGIEKASVSREGLDRNVKLGDQLGSNQHDSMLDIEPVIYDVHVVDDKTDSLKEDNMKESKSPICSASDHKTLLCDSERSSFSAVNNERLEIDAEIERLRERLRIVQGEKEKLTFPSDQRERVDIQLKLIEELLNQLRQLQQLKEPFRQSSLPPLASSSKVRSNRSRRCRSASDEIDDST
ncbi:hypothetical protein COLO4_15685 [Corchorus olitorius]|uniref:GTD-binding domain-containing protein n=1 Tax=Corchorus olitorius TaxID=93759 RepID=A0A1R3JLK4_9ROSI|nr:hypothetical protein COLO4_15685 [Corchorus olitorius]